MEQLKLSDMGLCKSVLKMCAIIIFMNGLAASVGMESPNFIIIVLSIMMSTAIIRSATFDMGYKYDKTMRIIVVLSSGIASTVMVCYYMCKGGQIIVEPTLRFVAQLIITFTVSAFITMMGSGVIISAAYCLFGD